MSFIHYTIVGHFDPTTLFPGTPLKPLRALCTASAQELLAEFPPEVAGYIDFNNGYATAQWAPCHTNLAQQVHDYAYRLAKREQCVAAESPFFTIMYPDSARAAQSRAADQLLAARSKG